MKLSKKPEIRADHGDIIGVSVEGNGNIIGKDISIVINQTLGYGLTLIHPNYWKKIVILILTLKTITMVLIWILNRYITRGCTSEKLF